MSSLGERLAELRRQVGLTQAALGAALSRPVSANSVRSWEKNVHHPSSAHLVRLAEVLRTTVNHLLGGGETGDTSEGAPAHARTYDPNDPPIPPGVQRLIDIGVPFRRGELARLLGYADPLDATRGARGAVGWTPGQWLDVLLDERRRETEADGSAGPTGSRESADRMTTRPAMS